MRLLHYSDLKDDETYTFKKETLALSHLSRTVHVESYTFGQRNFDITGYAITKLCQFKKETLALSHLSRTVHVESYIFGQRNFDITVMP